MGSIRSAIYDDGVEWESFKSRTKIEKTQWDVYSVEATFAREGYKLHQYIGDELRLYVKQACERKDLQIKHKKEWEDYTTFQALEKKFKS